MTEAELVIVRRAYAKQMLAVFGVTDPRVEAAFAAVRREAYLGPGPWPIWYLFRRGYVPTPSEDPVYLYQDVFVGLIPERNLNNGEPAGHAMLIACADARSGEHAVHIGAEPATTRRSSRIWSATPGGSRRSNTISASPRVWQ